MSTPNTNERKRRQPWLQLYLITKSCGRWELGLSTSSAAVLPLKMMLCTMFRSIQTFSVNGKFTEHYHIFCAWIDIFTIFVCSHYRPWATVRLLHHFGFVMCINSRLYWTHFMCQWRKIGNVLRQLTQISERQHDSWFLLKEKTLAGPWKILELSINTCLDPGLEILSLLEIECYFSQCVGM